MISALICAIFSTSSLVGPELPKVTQGDKLAMDLATRDSELCDLARRSGPPGSVRRDPQVGVDGFAVDAEFLGQQGFWFARRRRGRRGKGFCPRKGISCGLCRRRAPTTPPVHSGLTCRSGTASVALGHDGKLYAPQLRGHRPW